MGNLGHLSDLSPGEVIADACIHVIGVAAAISAVTALMVLAAIYQPAESIASLGIYCAGLLAVFGFSAGYHLISYPSWKGLLRHFDRSAIFLMIAGTYTPFVIVKMGGVWGYSLLAVVWGVAIIGIVLQTILPKRWDWAITALYLVQGWAVLAALDPLVASLPMRDLVLLALGGSLAGVERHETHGPMLTHHEYDRLFVVTLARGAEETTVGTLELRYGAASE